jgi:hypothetical protein
MHRSYIDSSDGFDSGWNYSTVIIAVTATITATITDTIPGGITIGGD